MYTKPNYALQTLFCFCCRGSHGGEKCTKKKTTSTYKVIIYLSLLLYNVLPNEMFHLILWCCLL